MLIPEHVLAQLARAPLGEFLRARARLAAELRQAGEPYAAMEVEATRKPTIAVWAINQLAHRAPAAFERASRSADALRAVQLGRVPAGKPVSIATAEYRSAVSVLVQEADAMLRAVNVTPTRHALGRIDAMLRAALARRDMRELLRRGRLTGELAPPGFEVFGESGSDRPRLPARARSRRMPDAPGGPDRVLRIVRAVERGEDRSPPERLANRGSAGSSVDAPAMPTREAALRAVAAQPTRLVKRRPRRVRRGDRGGPERRSISDD